MTFFDSKEEVLNIELTPYGKALLSRGKWKPKYYEFYDDDILYDLEYTNATENQNRTHERIVETKRIKTQYIFESVEKNIQRYKKQARELKLNLKNAKARVPEENKFFTFSSLPLANSKISEEYLPAWSVSVLRGKIDEISNSVSVVGFPSNLYNINLEDTMFTLSVEETENPEDEDKKIFENNKYIKVQDDYIVLDVREENVDFLKENFDMYIYFVETDEDGNELEIPLTFTDGGPLDDNSIENYLDIATDDDVIEDDLGVKEIGPVTSIPSIDETADIEDC